MSWLAAASWATSVSSSFSQEEVPGSGIAAAGEVHKEDHRVDRTMRDRAEKGWPEVVAWPQENVGFTLLLYKRN